MNCLYGSVKFLTLFNHVQSSQVQHASHFDHCTANRRFSPEIKKFDVSYISPQIILTEFKVLNDVYARTKAVNNSEFSVGQHTAHQISGCGISIRLQKLTVP